MNRRLLSIGLALPAIVAAALIAGRGISSANDISNYTTVFDTDFVSAGYGGMRGVGTGQVVVTGVTGTVTKALLFWQGPTNTTTLTANATIIFNGQSITGTNIGLSSDNCWGFSNSHAYRAEVTSLVTGNGTYTLSGFVQNGADVSGVSLIVFFDDGNSGNNRDVVLFDGNDSNTPNAYDADNWNVTLSGINYSSGTARVQLHVADGQIPDDGAIVVNSSELVAQGPIFSGDSVPRGAGGPQNGGLWDIRTWDITSRLSNGANTLTVTSSLWEDCLSLVVAAIDLPAGAAPGALPTATPHRRNTATPTATVTQTATSTVVPSSTPVPPTATKVAEAVPASIRPPATGTGTGTGTAHQPALYAILVVAAGMLAGGLAFVRFAKR